MSDDPKINLKENGPLLVSNPPIIRDVDGSTVENKPMVALCRCGLSKNKPFCDGSHNAGGFESAPDHSKIRNSEIAYTGEIDGQEVTVAYTPVLCSHSGKCSAKAASIFKPKEKPWVSPENGTMAELLSALGACPSGALRLQMGKEPSQHLTQGDVEISIEKHGPYWVKNVALDADFNGVGASRAKYVLCRCGQSKNKPFCDGTHYDVKWRDTAED